MAVENIRYRSILTSGVGFMNINGRDCFPQILYDCPHLSLCRL
jgi:hypothetical protein